MDLIENVYIKGLFFALTVLALVFILDVLISFVYKMPVEALIFIVSFLCFVGFKKANF